MKQTLSLLAIATLSLIPTDARANERKVRAIELALTTMDKALVDQNAMTWVMRHKDAHEDLFSEEFANSPKRASLLERYRASVAKAGAIMGPRAAKIIARDDRAEAKEDALAVLKEGIGICNQALSPNGGSSSIADLDQRTGEYVKKLERALRIDPNVVVATNGYVGPNNGGAAGNIAACELGLAFRKSTFEDSPPIPPVVMDGERKTKKGCGFVEYTVKAEKLRGGKTGAWEGEGESYSRALDCKEFPSKVKAPSAGIKAAVVRAFSSAKGGAVYEQFFDGDDANVKAVDFENKVALVERYKVIGVRVYSPNTLLRETSCKEYDPKISCGMSGDGASAITHYDGAKFRIARAEVRKKQGNAVQCKRLLTLALDDGRRFATSRDPEIKYKTTDGILDGAAIEQKMKALVALAEQRSDGGWCEK